MPSCAPGGTARARARSRPLREGVRSCRAPSRGDVCGDVSRPRLCAVSVSPGTRTAAPSSDSPHRRGGWSSAPTIPTVSSRSTETDSTASAVRPLFAIPATVRNAKPRMNANERTSTAMRVMTVSTPAGAAAERSGAWRTERPCTARRCRLRRKRSKSSRLLRSDRRGRRRRNRAAPGTRGRATRQRGSRQA